MLLLLLLLVGIVSRCSSGSSSLLLLLLLLLPQELLLLQLPCQEALNAAPAAAAAPALPSLCPPGHLGLPAALPPPSCAPSTAPSCAPPALLAGPGQGISQGPGAHSGVVSARDIGGAIWGEAQAVHLAVVASQGGSWQGGAVSASSAATALQVIQGNVSLLAGQQVAPPRVQRGCLHVHVLRQGSVDGEGGQVQQADSSPASAH